MNNTSAEETVRYRPAVNSGDGVIPHGERVTQVEAIPAGNYLASDSSDSVQITLAHFSNAGKASVASAVGVASRALLGPLDQHIAQEPAPETEWSETEWDEVRESKLGRWLLVAAAISVGALYTALYTIRNPEWMPRFVAQAVKITNQVSGRNFVSAVQSKGETAAIQPKGETAVEGVSRDSAVSSVRPAVSASLTDADRLAAQDGSTGGAHQPLAPESDGTGKREISRRQIPNGNHTLVRNAGDFGSGGEIIPALSKQSKKGFLVPPPPPTPCVLPPGFGGFPMQPAQQYAAFQQQLQEAQAQASAGTHIKAAGRENLPEQSTAASGKGESAELVAADQKLQSALKSSLHTVGEWTR
ncbi:MAG TPA: hypothetical protein V6C89_14465 [Drouetiella sp.]